MSLNASATAPPASYPVIALSTFETTPTVEFTGIFVDLPLIEVILSDTEAPTITAPDVSLTTAPGLRADARRPGDLCRADL